MANTSIEQVADILYHAKSSGIPCLPIRDLLPNGTIEEAYQVQKIGIEKQISLGQVITGKKIGLTNPAVQQQLGVDEPDFGTLVNTMEVQKKVLNFDELMQPKAEAEWGFVLRDNINSKIDSISELNRYIDYAVVTIEIVGSRIQNWEIQITDTVADNASASHYIVGEQKISLQDIDLINCQALLYKNDVLASKGSGKACMGNPLKAMQWLANTMINMNTPLQKGELVLSGALGPMVNLEKGDVLKVQIDDFDALNLKIY